MELAAVDDEFSSPPDPLSAVLAQLGERVAPIALARERTMPVAEILRDLFAEQALVRGRVMSFNGAASSSVAFAVAREAMVGGAWMAAVDVDTFGADAATELGLPLERVVRVDTFTDEAPERHAADWIEVMGAAADGFDFLLTRVPAALRGDRRPASIRKLTARLQQRGVVVLVLGDAGGLGGDVAVTTRTALWSGLGQGWGHLQRRRVDVEASGRRQPQVRTCSFDLVAHLGRVGLDLVRSDAPVAALAGEPLDDDRDPQAQVLAEMTASYSDDHLAVG